jgi:hypothetical protein
MSRLFGPIAALITAGALALGVTPNALALTRDRRAPTITISEPTSGAVVSGQMTVSGTAADNRRVAGVSVSIDTDPFALAAGTTSWSLTLGTTPYADGSHIVRVKAWDGRGNTRVASVSVTFDNGSGSGSASPASAGPQSMTTTEGTLIEIDSAGPWTVDGVYQMLKASGLDSTVGSHLKVVVQDDYPSQTSSSTTLVNGQKAYNATIYLQGVNSTFSSKPESVVAHELGHAWTLYYLNMAKNGDWSSYLDARGLTGDTRLNSTYSWSVKEIIAEDYRLLFGSDLAISQQNGHMNRDIPDPRNVAGLRDFLASNWTRAS